MLHVACELVKGFENAVGVVNCTMDPTKGRSVQRMETELIGSLSIGAARSIGHSSCQLLSPISFQISNQVPIARLIVIKRFSSCDSGNRVRYHAYAVHRAPKVSLYSDKHGPIISIQGPFIGRLFMILQCIVTAMNGSSGQKLQN